MSNLLGDVFLFFSRFSGDNLENSGSLRSSCIAFFATAFHILGCKSFSKNLFFPFQVIFF